jgi:ATP-dependent Clp protease protease subunit
MHLFSAMANPDTDNPTPTLQDNGMFVLMGEVSTDTVKPVIEWILQENFVARKRRKELLLMLCSEGGDMSAAFALIDVMRSSRVPVKTVGLGQIASAGLMIFLAGAPGRRVLTPNTSILSHQFSWGSDGKAHELFSTIKEFELTQRRMVTLYQECTGLDQETIRLKLLPPTDVWLDAQEAKDLHICDHVAMI